ncbi:MULTISPECIES: LysE family translocator [Prauserella salsuginis group]|uniref:LysE family translocator n=1 Tax=Prauserella salsuginis TaxID=387889 RepID=A0ABW6G550_9PSEU|nr:MULTISPECIES: LysE family translocator [Prauserella salsuginis group]MCR3718871.1 Threonine/homoserine/homoserine lactone efflux protein [Prauserella flava]MCR3733441.1 Threonine/homoserine/homoserine lactone efflux protein [Prauserella salsuginis]
MPQQLPVFIGTTLLMLIIPGPDFVLVTRNTATGGARRGHATTIGICSGLALLTLVAAAGVTAAASDPHVLSALRICGGAYLAALGMSFALAARSRRADTGAPDTVRSAGSPVVQGFACNVLNPKALIFYLTFIPQFVHTGGSVPTQTLLLGGLVVGCAALWWTLYVTALGALGAVLARPRVRLTLDIGAGLALAVLGVTTLASALG